LEPAIQSGEHSTHQVNIAEELSLLGVAQHAEIECDAAKGLELCHRTKRD